MNDSHLVNKPCPCESRKKFKHCCRNKLQRTTSISLEFGPPTLVPDNLVGISPDGSIVQVIRSYSSQPDRITQQLSYQRASKANNPKILTEVPLPTGEMALNISPEFKHFDVLFTVATNTFDWQGRTLSVTVAIKTTWNTVTASMEPEKTLLSHSFCFVESHNDTPVNAEHWGWFLLLSKCIGPLVAPGAPFENAELGLVTISDLKSHSEIQRSGIPIIEYQLPKNVSLLYATAAATDTTLNKIMEICDKSATGEAKRIMNAETMSTLRELNERWNSHFVLQSTPKRATDQFWQAYY